ncbi:hypothetical protein ACTMTI_54375 [Nonomuraea sp. H19]|uniref:hypothetical protein n=1 Tax=Nonomuraea sp. H19 TaxID=3452206 RepID=UPI003F89612F
MQNGDKVLKASRPKGAVIVVAAALALAGCGSDDGRSDAMDTTFAPPAVQTDPYQHAPWRLQVVSSH